MMFSWYVNFFPSRVIRVDVFIVSPAMAALAILQESSQSVAARLG
jgi:hypothetical protein